jgi:porin
MSPHVLRHAVSVLSGSLLVILLAISGEARADYGPMTDAADDENSSDATNHPPVTKSCDHYDTMQPRGTTNPLVSTCETVSPEWGGLRGTLADNGWFIEGGVGGGFSYDLFDHQEHPQRYIGQDPSFRVNPYVAVTYDLSRIGFGGVSQLVFNADVQAFSYAGENPTGFSINSLYVNQRFHDGQVQLQYGYDELGNQFYGFSLGTSATASTAGISSSIPYEVGLLFNKTAPAVNLRFTLPGTPFYERFGVTRSQDPQGTQADWDSNDFLGLKWHIPGAGPLYINEVGYLKDTAAGQGLTWLRQGVIYNDSRYPDFRTGGYAGSNYAYYLVGDYQLTQPDRAQPFRGFYINAKVDYAPPDRNVYSSDIGITPYLLGPFGRPYDALALSYTFNRLSKSFQWQQQAQGIPAVDFSSTYALSYVFRWTRGLYLTNQLSYTVNPIPAPKRPAALTWMSSLAVYY